MHRSAGKSRSHSWHVRTNVLSQAIELARTLKPDDAMRVRANDVKVAPPACINLRIFPHFVFVAL